MTRRTFMASAALPALAASTRLPIRKAVLFEMLPKSMSVADRMKLAVDTGFQATECPTMPDERMAEEVKKASEDAKLPIHSVMNMAHWKYPLSSADPAVVAESVKGMETSLRNAHFWAAETVLLVPAVVNPQTSYKDAWVRSQEQIRKLLPMAEELKVIIAVEEVWNKFLLSPLEYSKYIDDFQSPWLRSYFDVGNVVFYGYPQDWIRTVGNRIVKLHIKDFRYRNSRTEWVPLRDGDINWMEIYKALGEIGYHGTATVELEKGDEAYLREVNKRFEMILSGV
jgi:L-ribulose-5-phosphate 3-epimerase